MKHIYIIALLLVGLTSYAQESEQETKNEEGIVIKDLNDEAQDEVAFAVIENVPIYSGCNEELSNFELKKCMSNKVSKHVSNTFNARMAYDLGLPPGRVRINVIFKISKEGKVVDILARAPHPALEKEAIRVIGLIPDMDKPGFQKGKPVIVPYSLPIVFFLEDNSKELSKKEKRRLKRQKKS